MRPTSRLLHLMTYGLVITALPIIISPSIWPLPISLWGLLLAMTLLESRVILRGKPQLSYTSSVSIGVHDPYEVLFEFDWSLLTTTKATLRLEVTEPLTFEKDVTLFLRPGKFQIKLTAIPEKRGAGEIEALWILLHGPFGLFQNVMRCELDYKRVKIFPSLPRVREIALKHFGAWQYQGGVKLEQLPGDGSEFESLAAYVQGHDPRKIDWKASARHQALYVQRFRVERNQRVVFCLDHGQLMADPLNKYVRLDHAIHASLLLSYFALRAGDLVGLYSYHSKPQSWLPPTNGMRNFQRLHHACAEIHPENVETNHVLGLHNLLGRLKRRHLVVVFSDFTDTTSAELMIETMEHIMRKHLVIFVSFDDPVLELPMKKYPNTVEDIAQGLVASDLKNERRKVFQRLQKKGVHVVHGLPELATVHLIGKYTEIKRRELIG